MVLFLEFSDLLVVTFSLSRLPILMPGLLAQGSSLPSLLIGLMGLRGSGDLSAKRVNIANALGLDVTNLLAVELDHLLILDVVIRVTLSVVSADPLLLALVFREESCNLLLVGLSLSLQLSCVVFLSGSELLLLLVEGSAVSGTCLRHKFSLLVLSLSKILPVELLKIADLLPMSSFNIIDV